MNADAVSLASLLAPVTPDAIRNGVAARTKEDGGTGTVSLLGGFVYEQAADAVQSELAEVDVFELVASAFATVAELRKYGDAEAYPRERPYTLVMTNKTLTAPQDLEIGLEIEGLPMVPLVLTIDLEAEFECVRLTIGGGCITAIDLGTAAASAGLRYKTVTLVEPRKTAAVQLGKRMDLGDGIRIV